MTRHKKIRNEATVKGEIGLVLWVDTAVEYRTQKPVPPITHLVSKAQAILD